MDPKNKNASTTGLLYFGNGGQFPLSSIVLTPPVTVNLANVNWGLGGMDLGLSNTSFDDRATFRSQWKWRNYVSALSLAKRTVIGYTGGNATATDYIVAICEECEMYDIRMFLKSKGCNFYGLYLDGGGSTSGKNNGTIQISSTRRIPVIVSM